MKSFSILQRDAKGKTFIDRVEGHPFTWACDGKEFELFLRINGNSASVWHVESGMLIGFVLNTYQACPMTTQVLHGIMKTKQLLTRNGAKRFAAMMSALPSLASQIKNIH
jgi:predicted metallo-beta-lactamase superfamily hydrolase